MEIEENDGGGKSVILDATDDLGKIPRSHRPLLTPELRDAFSDPYAHFRRVAEVCPFPSMAAWLQALLKERLWELVLHRGKPKEWTAAGIRWLSETLGGPEIAPAKNGVPEDLPPDLGRYYALVDRVSWMPFGYPTGIHGCTEHPPLTDFYYTPSAVVIDPERTFVFGSSPCGDQLIYTKDGRGGWWCHETGTVYLLGTIAETIDWVYAERLAGRDAEFDYNHWL